MKACQKAAQFVRKLYPQYPAEMGRLIMKQEELGDKFIKYRHETYSHDVEIDTAYLCTLCDTLHIIQATQAEGGRLSVYQADLPIKDLEAVLDLIKEAKEV